MYGKKWIFFRMTVRFLGLYRHDINIDFATVQNETSVQSYNQKLPGGGISSEENTVAKSEITRWRYVAREIYI